MAKRKRDEDYLAPFRKSIEALHETGDFIVFSDGSANPFDKGEYIKFGCVIMQYGKVLYTSSDTCHDPVNTAIKAEVLGMVHALVFLLAEGHGHTRVRLVSDNQFAVNYCVNGKDHRSANQAAPYYPALKELRKYMKFFKRVSAVWVPRQVNQEADALAKK